MSGAERAAWRQCGAVSSACRATFTPLGIPLDVRADTPGQLAMLGAVGYGWENVPAPGTAPLALALQQGEVPAAGGPRLTIDGDRLRLSAAGVTAEADATARAARVILAPGRPLDTALREDVIEPLLLFLLTRNGRIPLHAAAFVAGDIAVLLAGPSGVGKSCLALAAHRAGYPLLSDDMVFVALKPAPCVYGRPSPLHLFPSDAPPGAAAIRRRNGKLKHVVPLAQSAAAPRADRAALCILTRGTRVSLDRLSPTKAVAAAPPLEPGFDLLAHDSAAAWAALAAEGAWRLTLSSDPAEAIALLAGALPRLRAAVAQ